MRIILMLMVLSLSACSSSPQIKNFVADEILSTSNDKLQPDWADETKPFFVKDGKVYSVGVTTLLGSERPEAGIRVSENGARSNISKIITNRMEFIFQNAEENADFDARQIRYIGSEVSTLTSHSMRTEGSWYKRYAQSEEDGSRRIYYRIYSLVTMPEDDLKKAMRDAIEHRVTEKKLSPTFQEQVDQHWKKIVDVKPEQPTPEKAPTSVGDQPALQKAVQEVKQEIKQEEKKEVIVQTAQKTE